MKINGVNGEEKYVTIGSDVTPRCVMEDYDSIKNIISDIDYFQHDKWNNINRLLKYCGISDSNSNNYGIMRIARAIRETLVYYHAQVLTIVKHYGLEEIPNYLDYINHEGNESRDSLPSHIQFNEEQFNKFKLFLIDLKKDLKEGLNDYMD